MLKRTREEFEFQLLPPPHTPPTILVKSCQTNPCLGRVQAGAEVWRPSKPETLEIYWEIFVSKYSSQEGYFSVNMSVTFKMISCFLKASKFFKRSF